MSDEADILATGGTNPYLDTIGGEAGKYGAETRLQLLRMLADGVMLSTACRALSIPRGAPYWWGRADPRYAAAMAHARRSGAAHLAGDTIDIADEPDLDRDGVQQARVRIAARQWIAARLDPETWGDKTSATVKVEGVRRTSFVSFLGKREIVEAEATPIEAGGNASDEVLRDDVQGGSDDDASE